MYQAAVYRTHHLIYLFFLVNSIHHVFISVVIDLFKENKIIGMVYDHVDICIVEYNLSTRNLIISFKELSSGTTGQIGGFTHATSIKCTCFV